MIEVEVLRVFCDRSGRAGNPLGVVLGADGISASDRQAVATELGYSETIFTDADARVQIFTPTRELPFAGHPLVGAAWRLGLPALQTAAGEVKAHATRTCAWILARPEQSPEWHSRRLDSPALVDSLTAPSSGHIQYWAWQDERSGQIRARVFAADYGVPEDPATGSAAIVLCAQLNRLIVIEQGAGSLIQARPRPDGMVELAGRVISDGTRPLEHPGPIVPSARPREA